MGAAMARSLAREGHEVAVWNRTPDRAQAVAGGSVTAHADLAEAVTGADVVLTMLFDADSVLGVTDDLLAALGPDAVWAQSTTVGPAGMPASRPRPVTRPSGCSTPRCSAPSSRPRPAT